MSDSAVQAGVEAVDSAQLDIDTDVSELDIDLSAYTRDEEPQGDSDEVGAETPLEETLAAIGVEAEPETATPEPEAQAAPVKSPAEEAPAEDRVHNLKREFERKLDNIREESREKDATIERLLTMVAEKLEPSAPEKAVVDPLVERLRELTDQESDPDQAIEAANIRAQLATKRAEAVEQRLEALEKGRQEREQQQAQATQQQQYLQWASSVAGERIDSILEGTHLSDNIEVKQRIFQSVAGKWAEVGYDQRFADQGLPELVAAEAAFFTSSIPAPVQKQPTTGRTVLPPPATPPPVVRSRGNPAGQSQGKRKSVAEMDDEEFIEFTTQHISFD